MGRKPKAEPQTQEEMIETARQTKRTKIYKAESQQISNEAISHSIHQKLADMKRYEGRCKIDLDDTNTVKALTESYLESCAVESVFPSMSGLAMALGYTRSNIYNYVAKRDNETSRFLSQIHDLMADILSENTLKGNANNIASIFILKAMFGYKDVTTFEFANGSPLAEPDANEILQRANLLTDD